MSDKIQILLQAHIDPKSIGDIEDQINTIQKNVTPIRLFIDTTAGINNIKDLTALLKQVEKQSKPIELKVETNKAELAMQNFAKSMGIKLDKELKSHLKELSNSMLGEFDESKFNELASRISETYQKAIEKHAKKINVGLFQDTDDFKIYDYLRQTTLKLDEATISAKKNVDGFSNAIRNLAKQSEISGLSLDQIGQELESIHNIKDLGSNTEDIADRLTKAVRAVREFKGGFQELHSDIDPIDIDNFVKGELTGLLVELGKIQHEAKKTKDELKKISDIKIEKPKQFTTLSYEELGVTIDKISKETTRLADGTEGVTKRIMDATDESGNLLKITEHIGLRTGEVYKEVERVTKSYKEQKKEIEAIEKAKSKNLWGMSKEILDGRTKTPDELLAMREYYQNLVKANEAAIDLDITQQKLYNSVDKLSNRYKNLIDPKEILRLKDLVNKLNVNSPTLKKDIADVKVEIEKVGIGAEKSRKSLDLANKSAMSFGEALKTAAYKFGIWSAVTASYYKIIREIAKGVRFITEMDTALTEIGMVTNQTREQTAGLAKEYNNLAKEMKVLTSEVTSGAVEFYRQGLSQEEVMERLRATAMYSKIANIDFQQSAELLTATVNSLGIEIERAADVFLFLGDSTATSGAEIAKGFAKTSGSVSALGLEFEKVASWIATISAKTRESAESIGHSINTMLSRFSRITETGFNEEDSTRINDVAKAYKSIGIEILDVQGNYKNFGDILDEIHGKWAKLDDQTRAYIANVTAGTRQQSRFYNLMGGYAESMELYAESLDAAGTAQFKFQRYLESNQATLDKFRTTIEGLWTTIIDSDSLMSLVKFGTSIIELLDSMVQRFGTLETAAIILTPIIGGKLAFAFRAAYMEATKLIATGTAKESVAMTGLFQSWAVKLIGVKNAADGAAISVGTLTAIAGGLTLAIGAITYALAKVASNARKAKEAFVDALDSSQNLNDELDMLERLAKKQQELSQIENKTAEQKEELLKVQRELAQLYPELATGVDAEGNKIADNTAMTKELVDAKKKLLEQELLVIKTTADKRLPQLKEELRLMQENADEIQRRLATGDIYETKIYDGYEYPVNVTDDLKDKLLELVEAQKSHIEEINKLEAGVKSYNQIVEERIELEKWARVEELQAQYARATTIGQYRAIEEELISLGFTHSDIANIISGNLDEVKNKYKELDMQQIINLQTIESLDAAQQQAHINMLESSRKATEQLIADTKARIEAIKAEMQALYALTGVKYEDVDIMRGEKPIGEIGSSLITDISNATYNEALQAKKDLRKLEMSLSEIDKALANVKSIDTKKISGLKSGGSAKSKKEEYKAEADRYERLNLELDKNNVLMQKNKVLQDLAGDDLKKKIRLMNEEIGLQEERQGKLHEYNNEQRREAQELENILSKQGFRFAGEGDERMIKNLDNIKGKTKEVEEQFNRYIQLQKTEIPKVSQEWWNLQNNIEKTGLSIEDMARKSIRELIDAEKRNAYLDMEIRQRRANERLKAEKQEMEDNVEYYQSKINGIQDEIDRIQESERLRQENLERSRRLEEISSLQEKYYFLQYKNMSSLTDEQAKALGLEREREEYLKTQERILDEQEKRQEHLNRLLELRNNLDNVRNEKNIQQLMKAQDGTWQFKYVADEREIDKIEKQIKDTEQKIEDSHKQIEKLEKDHNDTIEKLKEKTLESLKKAQKDYDEWEYQNNIRRQIESKQQRIKEYQDEIKDLKNKFAEREKEISEAFAKEKQALDDFYYDIDILTDEKMKELKGTFGDNWEAIHEVLTGKFSSITEAYLEMVDIISKPLDTSDISGSGDYDYHKSPSGSSSSSSSSSSNVRDGYTRMRKPNGSTTQVINSRVDDLAKKGWSVMHKGGIIGDGSRDLPELVNRLFNTKTDEQMVKGKIGELFVPEENLTKYFVPNMQELLKSAVLSTVNLVTPTVPKVALAGAAGGDIKQNINIDKLEFPNVKDAREIEGAIKNLSTFANQWANRK